MSAHNDKDQEKRDPVANEEGKKEEMDVDQDEAFAKAFAAELEKDAEETKRIAQRKIATPRGRLQRARASGMEVTAPTPSVPAGMELIAARGDETETGSGSADESQSQGPEDNVRLVDEGVGQTSTALTIQISESDEDELFRDDVEGYDYQRGDSYRGGYATGDDLDYGSDLDDPVSPFSDARDPESAVSGPIDPDSAVSDEDDEDPEADFKELLERDDLDITTLDTEDTEEAERQEALLANVNMMLAAPPPASGALTAPETTLSAGEFAEHAAGLRAEVANNPLLTEQPTLLLTQTEEQTPIEPLATAPEQHDRDTTPATEPLSVATNEAMPDQVQEPTPTETTDVPMLEEAPQVPPTQHDELDELMAESPEAFAENADALPAEEHSMDTDEVMAEGAHESMREEHPYAPMDTDELMEEVPLDQPAVQSEKESVTMTGTEQPKATSSDDASVLNAESWQAFAPLADAGLSTLTQQQAAVPVEEPPALGPESSEPAPLSDTPVAEVTEIPGSTSEEQAAPDPALAEVGSADSLVPWSYAAWSSDPVRFEAEFGPRRFSNVAYRKIWLADNGGHHTRERGTPAPQSRRRNSFTADDLQRQEQERSVITPAWEQLVTDQGLDWDEEEEVLQTQQVEPYRPQQEVLQEANDRLQADLTQTQSNLQHATAELEQTRSEVSNLQSQLESAQNEVRNEQQRGFQAVEDVTTEMNEMEQDLIQQRNELEAQLRQQLDRAQERYRRAEGEVTKLKHELVLRTKELEQAQKRLERLEKKEEECLAEKKKLKDELDSFNNRLAEKQDAVKNLETELSQAEGNRDRSFEDQENRIHDLARQNEELRAQLQDTTNNLSALTTVSNNDAEIAKLKQALEKCKKINKNLNQQLSGFSGPSKALVGPENWKAEKNRLAEDFKKCEKHGKELGKEVEALKNSLGLLAIDKEELQEELDELKAQPALIEYNTPHLRTQLSQEVNARQAAEAQISLLQEQLVRCKKRCDDLQPDTTALEQADRFTALEQENTRLQDLASALQGHIEQLETKLDECARHGQRALERAQSAERNLAAESEALEASNLNNKALQRWLASAEEQLLDRAIRNGASALLQYRDDLPLRDTDTAGRSGTPQPQLPRSAGSTRRPYVRRTALPEAVARAREQRLYEVDDRHLRRVTANEQRTRYWARVYGFEALDSNTSKDDLYGHLPPELRSN
ncbi:hypothetical protein M8818_000943 [Zalaria obscura]|uniref:Uncharacterized protein n=1 Tax=Zalaria obscura TaxID=2024903 RepID=A0ACC3SN96_9PEZI